MFTQTPDSCARSAFAITPANSDLNAPVRALYIGLGGDIAVVTTINQSVTFVNVQSGTILPISVKRVSLTGTTASSIVGLA